MSLFNYRTPEGKERFLESIYEPSPEKFRRRWHRGDVIFMEIMQDCNQAGEYLRYFYLYKGEYRQVILNLQDSEQDTPFISLEKEEKEKAICEYQYEDGTQLVFVAQRIQDYAYHFTLREIIQSLPDPRQTVSTIYSSLQK